ncbi:MAG: hypothetical protein SWY16_07340 [Cyanobacteriota bacterium]|nr:hypothetical protein [Cyanobacteriota bacterium]
MKSPILTPVPRSLFSGEVYRSSERHFDCQESIVISLKIIQNIPQNDKTHTIIPITLSPSQ